MTVYFAAYRGRIKIGFSAGDVARRMRQIGTHLEEPVTLIGTIDRGTAVEKFLHSQLAEFRVRGEWFRDCEEVRAFVHDTLANPPPDPIREPKVLNKPGLKTPGEYGAMLSRLADLVWPDEALRGMAEFSEVAEDEVRQWFAGKSEPPRLVRQAFASRVILFCSSPTPG